MKYTKVKIACLLAARPDSKYLSKFLFNFMNRTFDKLNTNLWITMNKNDNFNDDLVEYFKRYRAIAEQQPIFFNEDLGLGRAGLHEYFNMLLKHAEADWYIYFCEDHHIIMHEWDSYIRQVIDGGSRSMRYDTGSREPLDPSQPFVIVPKFDNAGAMNHIVSRGFIEAMGGVLARHGWADSYINEVVMLMPARNVILLDDEMLHDFSHDKLAQAVPVRPAETGLPDYDSPEVQQKINADAANVLNAVMQRVGK